MLFAQYGAGARDVLVACPNGIIIAILRLNEAQRLNRVFREEHCELWLFKCPPLNLIRGEEGIL
jgi:hypothetical protein